MKKTDETDEEWFSRMVRLGVLAERDRKQFHTRVSIAKMVAKQHAW